MMKDACHRPGASFSDLFYTREESRVGALFTFAVKSKKGKVESYQALLVVLTGSRIESGMTKCGG